jgi:hypothetical protein
MHEATQHSARTRRAAHRREPSRRSRQGGRIRARVAFATVPIVLASVFVPIAAAIADIGSLIGGGVWADVDRDGVWDSATEPVKEGVTVELWASSGGVPTGSAPVQTMVTGSNGAFGFSDMPDGEYVVVVTSPTEFQLPASDPAGGDNVFSYLAPATTAGPTRGIGPAITVSGASQHMLNRAGLQPIATVTVEKSPLTDACDGTAQTGTPPFDASEGPGLDTGTANCIIRTGDTVRQRYTVGLTGLPSGGEVPNVVIEYTVSSPDGAVLQLAGPGPDGMPPGCLTTAVGADPTSRRVINPDGSITVTCNLGRMVSNNTISELTYRVTGASAVPSHAEVTVRAYAGQGDAAESTPLNGPLVEVTGSAEWELEKGIFREPAQTSQVIDGQLTQGLWVRYFFAMNQPGGITGNGELDWPVSFTDRMTQFPNARIIGCRRISPGGGFPSSWGENWWGITCPDSSVPQGTTGWQLELAPIPGREAEALNDPRGLVSVDIFIPEDEVFRAVDPAWQPGDDRPLGTFTFENHAENTDGWAMNGGEPNNGDGFEDGWDGTTATGNNVTQHSVDLTEPEWDLSKALAAGPGFTERTINGETVSGYDIWYTFTIAETNGALLADWPENVAFSDVLTTHPNAELIQCRAMPSGAWANTGTPACESGAQPSDGWDMSFVPSQRGIDARTGQFQALFFIPAPTPEFDPCDVPDETLRIRNEARDSEGWTVDGELINGGTGLEPGWDGTAPATGNNVVDITRTQRQTVTDCGTYTGNKAWENGPSRTWPGRQMGTWVAANASNDRITMTDVTLCDVFDVSVLRLVENAYGAGRNALVTASGSIDLTEYVVEFAEGPNETHTQAPTDFSSIQGAAAGCEEHAGPWQTDPTAFGAGWEDRVNMIRVRPIVAGLEEIGPFSLNLRAQLVTRGTYNGGPNAGEVIPTGVLVTNVGGWTDRNAEGWSTVTRQVPFQGMILGITKSVGQPQYLPGDRTIWSITANIQQAEPGALMEDVRIVDTLPPGSDYDAACTADLLPDGVSVTFDPQANQLIFDIGDVRTDAATHWIFGGGKPVLQICTRVSTLAQPGDLHRNTVQITARNSANAPTAAAQMQIAGPGQLGVAKSVDKPYVASGETYTWSLEWANTSTIADFMPTDVIDVLPWNGDGAEGVGSKRDQLASDFDGVAQLTGPLEAPRYVVVGPGVGTRPAVGDEVPGTWYYATAAPSTIDHNPQPSEHGGPVANDAPEAPGGLWMTADEISDFTRVTAVRFVSSTPLPTLTRVEARIPQVATSDDVANLYVNRAEVYSETFRVQPLLSNEPYVQIPAFSLGDLVWIDTDRDGRYTEGTDRPGAFVTVQVIDDEGDVIATVETDENGRWSVSGLHPGTYRAFIPPQMFRSGGPLATMEVSTRASNASNTENEGVSNNNTSTPDPTVTGLLSEPVTLAYRYSTGADPRLIGANGPTDEDVAHLAPALMTPEFTNYSVDLAVAPVPGVRIVKYTNGEDANVPTGPLIHTGEAVTWRYVVTNTGSTELFDVTVTDDKLDDDATQIDCDDTGSNVVAGPLAIGASFECIATGTATPGQYANIGTVVARAPDTVDDLGNPVPGPEVTDDDPSHYFGWNEDVPPPSDPEDPENPEPPTDDEPSFGLAFTGAEPLTLTAAALALLLAGGFAVAIVRRRKKES